MSRPRVGLAVIAILVLPLVAACGGSGARGAPPETTDTVSIENSQFLPNHAGVTVGTTITWTNDDGYPHDVTFNDGAPKSGMLGGGATYQQTFGEAGTFDCECTIHPGMVGRVTVTES